MTAAILMMANTNSASPYPLTLLNVSKLIRLCEEKDVPEKVDGHNEEQEDGDPCIVVHFGVVPILDGEGGGDDF
jgi:hypothetical protein